MEALFSVGADLVWCHVWWCNMRIWILFIIFSLKFKSGEFLEFPCSDEYLADFELYGACVTRNCGRHLIQLAKQDIELVDKIADLIYSAEDAKESSTVLTLDLASNKLTLDGVPKEFQFKDKSQLEALTDTLIDTIGHNIRSKTKKLFQIEAKLWISR